MTTAPADLFARPPSPYSVFRALTGSTRTADVVADFVGRVANPPYKLHA